MSRREIIEAAKQLVLANGPSNCLEFTDEMLDSYSPAGGDDRDSIYAEVRVQAERVYRFLGYDSPWQEP